MNRYFLECARGTLLVALSVTFASGCSVVDSFEPEVFQIDGGEITTKGWTEVEKSEFKVNVALKPGAGNLTLHSLNLVCPDGKKLPPDSWKDKTPRSAAPRLSFGMGFGLGGGGGHHPDADSGGGSRTMLTPGVSVPLAKENSKGTVTNVSACWKTPEDLDLSQCDLEVNLARTQRDEITLTTLVLEMGYHEDEKKEDDESPEDDKETAKDLIREIDFTQKGPPKTRSLKV